MDMVKLMKEMIVVFFLGFGQLILLYLLGSILDIKMVMEWMVVLFVGLVGLIVLYWTASGKIDLKYLLSEENTHASMSRFQLLIFTFIISVSLFLIIISKSPPEFPASIPTEILTLLGISGGSYVIAKGIQSNKEIQQAKNQSRKSDSPDGADSVSATGPKDDQPNKG